jgi:CHAD domain-containing protein
VTTDAATAVLVALRTRVQSLHEALDAVETADAPAPGTAAGLRDAADRLAALLSSMHAVLDTERTEPARAALAPVAAAAGRGRDAEVLDELIADLLAEVPKALVSGPLADRVRRHLRERRGEGADTLAKAVRDERWGAVVAGVDRLVITPPLAESAGAKAPKVLARCAREDDERLAAAVAAVRAAPTVEPGTEPGWPAVRDAALALAGSAGAAAPEHGKKAAKLASRADDLAGRVDDLLDTVRARRLIVDLADLAHRHREPGFTYGVLHAAAARRGEIARVLVEEALDDLASRKRRSWM